MVDEAHAKFKHSVTSYLRAGFPCLYCSSVEDQRTIDMIAAQAAAAAEGSMGDVKYELGVWKITGGFTILGKGTKVAEAEKIDKAFTYVATRPRETPMVGIFMNVRQLIANPLLIQTFKDAIYEARVNGNHIILAGPSLEIPPELQNFITYADIALPSREELTAKAEELLEAYQGSAIVPESKAEKRKLLIKVSEAALGMTEIEAENAFALSLAEFNELDVSLIQGEKEQAIRKSEVLEYVRSAEGIDDIGDADLLKAWIARRISVFSDEAREYGLPYPKGILLLGPPGTGKSLTAKAVASYLQLPLVKFDIGAIFKKYVGESEATVRNALKVVEAVAPVVVWLDELEKGLAGSAAGGSNDSGVSSRVLGTILTWMQERECMAFCIATVNNIQALPPELYRTGRFDSVFAIDLPQTSGRKEIFEIHIRKRDRIPKNYDLQALAIASNGFVGAEIEHVIEEAMFTAFDDDEREFETKDILKAIAEHVPQSKMDVEKINLIREFCKDRARPVSSTSPAYLGRTAGDAKPKGSRKTRAKNIS